MIKIDMYYNDTYKDADHINIYFNGKDGTYYGNLYKDNKAIGDYVCDNSVQLEETFTQFKFAW